MQINEAPPETGRMTVHLKSQQDRKSEYIWKGKITYLSTVRYLKERLKWLCGACSEKCTNVQGTTTQVHPQP